MRNLQRSGEKVAAFIINADLQKTSDSIGYFLLLPEGVEISGNLDSEVDVIARPEGSMLFSGSASVDGLYFKKKTAGSFSGPIRIARASSSFEVVIDPEERLVTIEDRFTW
jgi:hypothetical protein